ncbi:Xanthine oxidase [Gonapodya prolifera JEL478]|uniref:Xanthine oxidase n=1 Tax=Gonapodya prolifera (strain JEL478) TaxID=1344416 RepID=A0A139AVR4_GONPJ|nr:Xanthine oxidase [Gonapodya prolifera JEL478]|eukprot:KXS20831.1 Xanthine oxidase [Gonapodya prolifera JEL478]
MASPTPMFSPKALTFTLNGKPVVEKNPGALNATILGYARSKGLTGPKFACGEGECGACTVVVSGTGPDGTPFTRPVVGCVTSLAAVDGLNVTTVEGIGTVTAPHPVQTALAKSGATQCGYCTPGFTMAIYAAIKSNPHITESRLEHAIAGNICRCTGYRGILDGAKKFACGGECASCPGTCPTGTGDIEDAVAPARAVASKAGGAAAVEAKSGAVEYIETKMGEKYFVPKTVDEVVAVLTANPTAKLVAAGIEVYLEQRFKRTKYPIQVALGGVKELHAVTEESTGTTFGPGLTLSSFHAHVTRLLATRPDDAHLASLDATVRGVNAGAQIVQSGTLGGNVCVARTTSDLAVGLAAVGAVAKVVGKEGKRDVPMGEFFVGGKTVLSGDEVVTGFFVPFASPIDRAYSFKTRWHTRDDAHPPVTAAFKVTFDKAFSVVKSATAVYGGIGEGPLVAPNVAAALAGKPWTQSLITDVRTSLGTLTISGGHVSHRLSLASTLFVKFYHMVASTLPGATPDPRDMSAVAPLFHAPVTSGSQDFALVPEGKIVGAPVPHAAALQQTTGEAIYVDDMPKLGTELWATPVLSTEAHAKIKRINIDKAAKFWGIVAVITADDVRGLVDNTWGTADDEQIFADGKVVHEGQLIAMVVGYGQGVATAASYLVEVEYEPLPKVITIEDAIAANSFFDSSLHIARGAFAKGEMVSDLDEKVSATDATYSLEGTVRIAAQEHFYLETQVTRAIPYQEDQAIELFSATQAPNDLQQTISRALGIPLHKVSIRTKRLGGGFGGKETRAKSLALAVSACAWKLKMPIRCQLSREADIASTGMRHPFLGKYKVGFTNEGKLVNFEVELVSNAGHSTDMSPFVMQQAHIAICNVYNIPNVSIRGRLAKTNIVSQTAFRGFGKPQGNMVCERMIVQVAEYLGKDPQEIRELNMYKEGDYTHNRTPMRNWHLRECWDQVIASSEYARRKADVDAFNRANKYKKRGIHLIPTMFGIGMPRVGSQASALVHVHVDGSVLIYHGGVEMGQGLHTKCLQIAAQELGVPLNKVHLHETSTTHVINATGTGGSVGTDLNGASVLKACQVINERLKTVREQHPDADWAKLCSLGYEERVNMTSQAHITLENDWFDWKRNKGSTAWYQVPSAGVTEVELDVLTGDYVIVRTDLCMELGESINPHIDITQIEGGYIQGVGWTTMEEPLWSPTTGKNLTTGPGSYIVPRSFNIPATFNVSLLKGKPNPQIVHSSKGVGEPPYFLGATAYFAIRDAVKAARAEFGADPKDFTLEVPSTPWRIRAAIGLEIAQESNVPYSVTA